MKKLMVISAFFGGGKRTLLDNVHVKLNSIRDLLLNKRKDFVLSMIQDHKDECDFKTTLQNLKDFSGK